MIPTEAWVLPRPSKSLYPGSFPLHFEKKLLRLLNWPEKVLHPFGGMAEYGVRVDLRATHPLAERFGAVVKWRAPDIVGDAHALPFQDGTFDCVICDPPYSDSEAQVLYGTPPLRYNKYIGEAVRVAKCGGYVCSYNVVPTGRPVGTIAVHRILIATRTWHKLRCCMVFQKE